MNNILGEDYKGDSKFVAKCRKLQSIYRHEIGEAIRPYHSRNGQIHYYGNYISDGEEPKDGCWKNFLTEEAFVYAKNRVENIQKYETIESDRLFNNLLSSQPMAFNLFCPLRQMLADSPEVATQVIKAALPMYPIYRVTEVDLEFIPDKYMVLSGDKSAMDAIIRFEKENGDKGFIAIETKYSENLGTNVAYERGTKKPRKGNLDAVRSLCCFKPDVEERIVNGVIKLTQIYRNFLLSETYGAYLGIDSYSIILAPEDHPSTKDEVLSLTNELRDEYKHKVISISLEDFLSDIIATSPEEYRSVFERFYDRYLNFGKLNNTF